MIKSIGHVAFRVSDLDKSVEFYCERLGLREAFRLQDEGEPPRCVYLVVAPGQFLELFPPPAVAPAELPRANNAFFRHICLVVDDLMATVEELAGLGVATVTDVKKGVRDHNWQAFIEDPDGNRIELMQIDPSSPQARAS